jgi:hypothetical protein
MSQMDSIGNFEYNKKDLIGHGAFAIVYKGRQKAVCKFFFNLVLKNDIFLLQFNFLRIIMKKWRSK